ncbi:MAG TPA: PaaI family thioesterase [Acidimicrobiales bacterium]|nr:PaaI family thioesterase [Acidimicrobiales bacterium]
MSRDAGPEQGTGRGPGPDPGDGDGEGSGVSDFGISLRGEPVAGPRPWLESGEAVDPRFTLADAVRRLTRAVVGLAVPDELLRAAAAELAQIADRLEGSAPPGRRPRRQPDPAGHPQDFFPTSPIIGFANPVAPPVLVEAAAGGLVGRAYFDYQYEGPPGCVHGGVIAMVFDELLGAATIAAGCPGMTGTLTIRYRKPTPLRSPLRLEARVDRREGRKIFAKGSIFREETVLAEAEGIFIEMVPERFLSLVAAEGESPEMLELARSEAVRPPSARPTRETDENSP